MKMPIILVLLGAFINCNMYGMVHAKHETHTISESLKVVDALILGDIYFYGLFDHPKDLAKSHCYYTYAATSPIASSDERRLAESQLAELDAELDFITLPVMVRSRSHEVKVQ